MKKRIVPIILAAVFAALCACNVKNNTASTETPLPTEQPTETPTEQPTEVPTPAPTVIPIDAPDFPELPKLGNLTGGALLTGDAAYLVINGESDLHYVYDRFGEFVAVFHAGWYKGVRWSQLPGIYGEHGAPYGYSIERREFLPYYCFTGGCAINMGMFDYYYTGEESGNIVGSFGFFVREILDASLENKIEFKDAPEYVLDDPNAKPVKAYELGRDGGVLKIGEDFLLLNRGVLVNNEFKNGEIIVVGPDGHEKERIDPAKFGYIEGGFADKYIIAGKRDSNRKNLYTLSGEIVKENISGVGTVGYTAMTGRSIPLYACDYLYDSDGSILNKDLQKIGNKTLPEDAWQEEGMAQYLRLPMENYGIKFGYSSVYAGITDMEGNWLFRVYHPQFSMDGK